MIHRKMIDKYLKLPLNFKRLKLTYFISNENIILRRLEYHG